MKKTFLAILAAAAMVACAQEEVLRTQGPVQIGFDGAYVDNSVRAAADPSFNETTTPLTAFDVWGYMDNGDGKVFTREEVSGGKGNWDYVNKQYWVPGHTYRFFALAPAKSNNVINIALADNAYADGIAALTFTNVDGTEDLLYASKEDVAAPAQGATTAAPVKFAFDHLLSKVKFTFKNGIENTNAHIEVTNIKMVVPEQGTIALNLQSNYAWENLTGAKELSFGHLVAGGKVQGLAEGECDYERLTIPAPATQAYKVTFTVKFYMGTVLASTADKEITITNVKLEPGNAYNFVAILNADNVAPDALLPIVFDVEKVNDWVNAGNNDVTGFVATADELATALADGGNVTLANDIAATANLVMAENTVLDGATHTLTPDANGTFTAPNYFPFLTVKTNGTVANLTIDGQNMSVVSYIDSSKNCGIRGIYLVGEGAHTLSNVTIKNVTYTLNDDSAAKTLVVKDSTLAGWTSYNPDTTAEFTNVTFVAGTSQNTFRPHGETVLTNCKFDNVVILLDKLAHNIAFVGCTFNGNPLTADDLTSVPTNVTVTIQ